MEAWKTDTNLFAIKILKRIEEEGDTTYTFLQNRAVGKGISLDFLDQALEKLRRRKKVNQRVKGDEIIYSAVPKEKPKSPFPGVEWLKNNYPYPTNFVMPFPEIDMSHIFLSPQEMKEHKAKAKGMPLYLLEKKIKDRIKKAVQ